MPVLALWLADVLHAAGLDVYETAGWTLRGKPMDAIEGVVAHHTASPRTSSLATNLAVVTNGTNGTPGPIAQLLIWRDASVHVIAAGKANHAGAGGPIPGWLPVSPPGQLSTANARTIGIEVANDGVGEPWSADLLDAFEIATAAILAHIGATSSRTITHHEWAPTRKIDPAGPTGGRIATLPGSQTWSPDAWRARVALRLEPPAPHPAPDPPTVEDDDMKAIIWSCPELRAQFALVQGRMVSMPGEPDASAFLAGLDAGGGYVYAPTDISADMVHRLGG